MRGRGIRCGVAKGALLNLSADGAEVLPEGYPCIGTPGREVLLQTGLAPAVVDGQDVAGFGPFDGPEEDIDVAEVPGRSGAARRGHVYASPRRDG
jgi:hypothetical protein